MMRWAWLSHPMTEEMPVYGDGEKPTLRPVKAIAGGDSCNTSRWTLPNHVGTHVDLPRHFFQDGADVTAYPAEFWVFRRSHCLELTLPEGHLIIGEESIPWGEIPWETELLLIKTGFGSAYGEERYWREPPGLAPELAGRLRKELPLLRAVGFDFISVSSWQHRDVGRLAHRAFLDPAGPPLLLIEDMALAELKRDTRIAQVIVAPLRAAAGDGSPCTILAEVNA